MSLSSVSMSDLTRADKDCSDMMGGVWGGDWFYTWGLYYTSFLVAHFSAFLVLANCFISIKSCSPW